MGAAVAGRAHVFVADVERPELEPDDRHHLERVLRLRAGDEITVSDGAGRWRVCRLGGTGPGLRGPNAVAGLDPAGEVVVEARPAPTVTVGFALTKGERPELAVQKLTEIGVDRIVPFTAARSIVRWDGARAAANAERWRRIAREASSQSRRVWLPDVLDVQPFDSLLGAEGLALADQGGRKPSLGLPFVLVGPEGGWSEGELAAAEAAGVPRVALATHVLRAETGAMAAGVLLCGLRAKLVQPAQD